MQNNKRYWLYFGSLMLAIGEIVVTLQVLFGCHGKCSNATFFDFISIPAFLFNFLVSLLIPFDEKFDAKFMYIVSSGIFYFLIGSFFGYLYGKIKNRNKV